MSRNKKIIVFLMLILGYVLAIHLCGKPFVIFSRKHGDGPGIDIFVVGAYLACFHKGPTAGAFEPYPYRDTFAFLGCVIMIAWLLVSMAVS